MPNTISRIINYFHDCYRADNRELVIYDFLDSKVEDKMYFDGKEELLTGDYPIVPVDSEKAVKIIKKTELFEREKELLYATFFISGSYTDMRGSIKRLFAPLFYYPAQIEQKEEFYYLSVNTKEGRINHPLLHLIANENSEGFLSHPLLDQFPKDGISFEHITPIVQFFQKFFPLVKLDHIYSYPDNEPISRVKKQLNPPTDSPYQYVLQSTAVLGMVSKSSNTRGVLNELQDLAAINDYSSPLKTLFTSDKTPAKTSKYRKGKLPVILSEAQEAILKSSSVHPVSLIIGPPGTGKTYTISSVAIEHMSRGESVLIASRTDEAVDVIHQKITEQLGTGKPLVRNGKKRVYATPLKQFLKSLLIRVNKRKFLLKEFGLSEQMSEKELYDQILKLSSRISQRKNSISALEKSFEKEIRNEIKWGEHLASASNGKWDKLKTKYLAIRNKFQTPVWEYSHKLKQNDSQQVADISLYMKLNYIRQILNCLKRNWKDIQLFHEALKMSSDTEKMEQFNKINFKAVFKAFPIWLSNLSELKDALPLQKEMFDLVIIDEATQCDIASCIPLLQRAKRVVFAGDPNQLRHVSFLSRDIQNKLQAKYELEQTDSHLLHYREKSILDIVMHQLQSEEQVSMLDEHYRSLLPIINFSNEKFYGKQLRIMTNKPDEEEQALYLVHDKGKREKNGINQCEAESILKMLKEQIKKEKKLSQELCSSLGVLSPFRSQADQLSKLILDEFSLSDIEKHKIRVGTAYSFQGEERDVMHLSFAVDSDSHHSAYHHINKEDVFNVSITRARQQQYIHHSVDYKELSTDSLFHSYLSGADQYSKKEILETPHRDQFLKEIKEQMKTWEVDHYWSAYSIAGLTIDLLIKQNENYYAIDLVGYPGEFVDVFGMERYRILHRANIKVMPLPYSDWYFEREKSKNILKEFIFKLSSK